MDNKKELPGKVAILKMVYDNIRELNYNTFLCEDENGYVALLDSDANEYFKVQKDKFKMEGSFVVYSDENNNTNVMGLESKKITRLRFKHSTINSFNINISSIGKDYLVISLCEYTYGVDKTYIINSKLQVTKLPFAIRLFLSKIGEQRINYLISTEDSRPHTFVFNRHTKTLKYIDIRDIVKINEYTFTLVSTEISDKTHFSINSETSGYLKYALYKNERIVSKHYLDITKTLALTNTPYFEVYDKVTGDRIQRGIIDDNGAEILPPIYDSINFLGNNTWLLTLNAQSCLYNSERGVLINWVSIENLQLHDGLPVCILRKNNETFIIKIDTLTMFPVNEIAKHFKCSYNSENTSIIKVDIGKGVSIYVDNRLTTINNFKLIHNLNKFKWIDMH